MSNISDQCHGKSYFLVVIVIFHDILVIDAELSMSRTNLLPMFSNALFYVTFQSQRSDDKSLMFLTVKTDSNRIDSIRSSKSEIEKFESNRWQHCHQRASAPTLHQHPNAPQMLQCSYTPPMLLRANASPMLLRPNVLSMLQRSNAPPALQCSYAPPTLLQRANC